jgi:Fe-S cluster assembly protein SufD
MAHPRLLVVVEREAQLKLVEAYEAAPAGPSLTNAVTEVVLEDGAQLEICREQREGERSFHVATSQSRQGRDSRLVFTTVALGGALTRHDINAVLDGTGAYLILNGLSVLGGRQHVDHHTTIEHAQPHGESHEYFNGVFDGESRGVFNGRIIVRPGAQRTDSKQTNNNLLLSDAARADSQPQLEIYADDVKCTHGSTVGPLDETALFYLKSRGIGAVEARGLLTYGFGADILDRVAIPGARARLDRQIRHRLRVPDPETGAA